MTTEELQLVMNDFKESRGWKEIQSWIKPIIDSAQLRLLGDEVMSDVEQKDLKRVWKLHKKFYDMPDFIIAKSQAGIDPKEHNMDPYA